MCRITDLLSRGFGGVGPSHGSPQVRIYREHKEAWSLNIYQRDRQAAFLR